MPKLKQYWPIILLVVIILGGLFYWYEIRPALIKHNCSWIKKHTNEVKYQMPTSNWPQCREEIRKNLPHERAWDELNNDAILEEIDNGRKINCHGEINYEPAKDWWKEANESEYKFCIREKGL